MYISKEQCRRARRVDLAAWLLRNHGGQVVKKYGSVLLKSDEHISVKEGYSGYHDFRSGETGNPVDYLMRFLGYSYQEAVIALTSDLRYFPGGHRPVIEVDLNKRIHLPEPAGHYRNVYKFLEARGISGDMIRLLIDEYLLYQSEQGNNAVFVTPQKDYAEIRGTNTYADRRCRKRGKCKQYQSGEHMWCQHMCDCSDYKPDPFHGCLKTSPDRFWYFQHIKDRRPETVYVCEAAIDAVSLRILHQKQGINAPAVYASIGGAANQQAINRLKQHDNLVLALDNDDAGEFCRKRNPDISYIIPKNKDWNDDLRKETSNGPKD